MIFMGEEWARLARRGSSSPSFDDDLLADAVRRGPAGRVRARTAGREDAVPDPQDPATRDALGARLGRGATAGHHARMLQWYAACTGLRRELLGEAPTRFADVAVTHDEDARWLVMRHAPAGRGGLRRGRQPRRRRPGGARSAAPWRTCCSRGTTWAPQLGDDAVRMPATARWRCCALT